LGTVGFQPERGIVLAVTAVVSIALPFLWYRLAVAATDDWAAVVRAVVNLGRKPLAEALGLQLPSTIREERAMWAMVYKLAVEPYPSVLASGNDANAGRRIVPGNLGGIDRYRRRCDGVRSADRRMRPG
jgi:hypothetical protein